MIRRTSGKVRPIMLAHDHNAGLIYTLKEHAPNIAADIICRMVMSRTRLRLRKRPVAFDFCVKVPMGRVGCGSGDACGGSGGLSGIGE